MTDGYATYHVPLARNRPPSLGSLADPNAPTHWQYLSGPKSSPQATWLTSTDGGISRVPGSTIAELLTTPSFKLPKVMERSWHA